jgi:hypothetical protein
MKINNLMSCISYALSFNIPSPKLLIPFIDCATNVLHCPNSDRTPKDADIHARECQLSLPSKEELQQELAEWIKEQSIDGKPSSG